MPVYRGKVAWFSNDKGFGFIERAGGQDLFVHYTAIQAEGFRGLDRGDVVDFEVVEGDKGLQATNVVLFKAAIIEPQT